MTVNGAILTGQSPPNTVVSPQAGMYIRPVVLVDASGNPIVVNSSGSITVTAASTVTLPITFNSGAQAASNTGISFGTTTANSLRVDITLTSFTGGTTPTVTFFVETLGNDGVWYRIWASAAINSATVLSTHISPSSPVSGPTAVNSIQVQYVNAVLTGTTRFGWSSTGSPTAITFSASVVCRY